MPMLEKYFSRVPGGPKPEEMTTVEPKQFAEKTVVIREPTQPIYIEGYHRPDYRDPDDAVYDAISDIMSNGRVSRLYRSLVARAADCRRSRGRQPLPRRQVSQPVRLLRRSASRPHAGGDARRHPQRNRKAEDRRRHRRRAGHVQDPHPRRSAARPGRQPGAGQLALAEYQTRYGDWRELFLQLDKVDKVTKADIRRVANQVFVA